MTKKLYWLKMHKDFFKSKDIKKLRKISGGDTFVIIYLKMMLLSIETGGVIIYEGIEPTFAEELALELDEDAVNVNATLLFLQNMNLISEDENDQHTLNHVKQSIGSETPQAGYNRKRRSVENQPVIEQNVTELLPVTKPLQQRVENREKRIEIDNKEPDSQSSSSTKKESPEWLKDHDEYCNFIKLQVVAFYERDDTFPWFEGFYPNLDPLKTLERVSEVLKNDDEYARSKKKHGKSKTGKLNWTSRIKDMVSWNKCRIFKERN